MSFGWCVLTAAAALGVAAATRSVAYPASPIWTTTVLATVVVAVVTQLVFAAFLQSGSARRRHDCSGRTESRPEQQSCLLQSGRRGFPRSSVLLVDEGNRAWFEDALGRLYNCDFNPGQQAIVPVKHLVGIVDMIGIVRSVDNRGGDNQSEGSKGLLHEPVDDTFASRALLGTDFDVVRASNYAKGYIAWREQVGGPVPPPLAWLECAQVLVPFQDRHGRPVVVVRACYHHPKEPEQKIEILREGYRATLDAVITHSMLNRGTQFSQTNPLEQYVVFLDLRGVTWANVSFDTLKMMIRESQLHYADRLSQVFVLFPTQVFQAVWKMATPLIHPRSRRKVRLIPHDKVPAFVSDLIGNPEAVPSDYGGSAPYLRPPSECETLEDMAGNLAAAAFRALDVVPPGITSVMRRHRSQSSSVPLPCLSRTVMCCGSRDSYG